jgi:hypothetical protein
MRSLWRRLGVLVRRSRLERELEEEMRSHLEMQADEDRASGMDPREAEYAARRQFGNLTLLRETSRELWAWAAMEEFARGGAATRFGHPRRAGCGPVAARPAGVGGGLAAGRCGRRPGDGAGPLDPRSNPRLPPRRSAAHRASGAGRRGVRVWLGHLPDGRPAFRRTTGFGSVADDAGRRAAGRAEPAAAEGCAGCWSRWRWPWRSCWRPVPDCS